jgi:hypothetical protein
MSFFCFNTTWVKMTHFVGNNDPKASIFYFFSFLGDKRSKTWGKIILDTNNFLREFT